MAKVGVVGLGRLTLSRRERMVVVEPRGTGMALFTLRAAGEVRVPQFGSTEGDLEAEMVAIAGAIIRQRTGNFDPSRMRGRGRRQTGEKRKRRCRPSRRATARHASRFPAARSWSRFCGPA